MCARAVFGVRSRDIWHALTRYLACAHATLGVRSSDPWRALTRILACAQVVLIVLYSQLFSSDFLGKLYWNILRVHSEESKCLNNQYCKQADVG